MMMDDPISESSFTTLLDPRQRDANFIEFFWHAVQNKAKTDEVGRPQFDSVQFIRITSPGGKSVVERPVTENDKRKYSSLYERFLKGEEKPLDGTPLKEWPYLSVGQIKNLQAQNIYTVEQITAIPDSHIQCLGLYGIELRAKANDFVKKAETQGPVLV